MDYQQQMPYQDLLDQVRKNKNEYYQYCDSNDECENEKKVRITHHNKNLELLENYAKEIDKYKQKIAYKQHEIDMLKKQIKDSSEKAQPQFGQTHFAPNVLSSMNGRIRKTQK